MMTMMTMTMMVMMMTMMTMTMMVMVVVMIMTIMIIMVVVVVVVVVVGGGGGDGAILDRSTHTPAASNPCHEATEGASTEEADAGAAEPGDVAGTQPDADGDPESTMLPAIHNPDRCLA